MKNIKIANRKITTYLHKQFRSFWREGNDLRDHSGRRSLKASICIGIVDDEGWRTGSNSGRETLSQVWKIFEKK